jgi:hypothetical protein
MYFFYKDFAKYAGKLPNNLGLRRCGTNIKSVWKDYHSFIPGAIHLTPVK